MTTEEIEIFNDKIKETILPLVKNMNARQIQDVIDNVNDENIPDNFKAKLLEMVLILKEKEFYREMREKESNSL